MCGAQVPCTLIGEWAAGLVVQAGVPADDLGVFIMPNAVDGAPAAVIVEGSPLVVSVDGAQDENVMKALAFLGV